LLTNATNQPALPTIEHVPRPGQAAAPLSSMMNWQLSSARPISVGRAHLDAKHLRRQIGQVRLLNAFALD
jgi:hypothetical protein